MIKIGITGQNGFIGTHLYNTLGLEPEKFQRVPFKREFFQDCSLMERFVSQCEVIVHLAAMNRHGDPQVLYDTNIRLVKQLIDACEATGSGPHVLFASSMQEERDNLYGQSKKKSRLLLENWATKNQARLTSLIIPNVFGPFGRPYYNSVVATFCHQLTRNEQPKIDVDGELKLIYVGELTQTMINHLTKNQSPASSSRNRSSPVTSNQSLSISYNVPHTTTIKVSQLLEKLTGYKEIYFEHGIIPHLEDPFDRNLFNTFVCYIDHASFYPGKLAPHKDQRGCFVEVIKLDKTGGQVSFSTTVPGVTRGNHFHTRKAERFAVIKGKARIEIRRIGSDKILSFELDGSQPGFVDMPIWNTHSITNIGQDEMHTIFWINEHYDPNDPDTYFEKV